MQSFRSQPWRLVIFLAPVPLLVTLLGMLSQLGPATFGELVLSPGSILDGPASPWPAILGPMLVSMVLVGLFAWLAVAIPGSTFLHARALRLRRAVAAAFALLTAATFWLGVILGDILWHTALGALPGVGKASSLESATWQLLLAVLVSAGALYALIRPAGRKRGPGD